MDVIVFGSIIMDLVSYVPRLPKPGETLHGTKFATGYGGKGANQCVAAAKMGAKTQMIGKLGNDYWGRNYIENLQRECVNVDLVELCDNQTTGIAQIQVADNGENCITIVVGANNLLSSKDVVASCSALCDAKVLICQLETPVEGTLRALQEFKGVSILNAAPALADLPKDLLCNASIFCVNESEAALTAGTGEIKSVEDSKNALKKILEMGANTVVITLGALGVTYCQCNEPDKFYHIPAPKVDNVVDTTGAGDAFIGALSFYIAKNPKLPLHQQIGAACVYASISVQSPGTQSSFPSVSQFNTSIVNKNFEYKTF